MRKVDFSRPTFGSWITIGNPIVAEIMAQARFDWLVLDMEHSVISLENVQQMIQTIESYNVIPLVRLSSNDPTQIKRVMDAGSYGVIVPMVNASEDAKRAVDAVKYPPQGCRGVGLARAQKYGQGFEEYLQVVNRESTVIVQIEHIRAVENIEEILSTPGIDGFIVGPYDLSGSMGVPGDFGHPKMLNALEYIYTTAKRLKMPAGYHIIQPDKEEVTRRQNEGFIFLALSLDIIYLGNYCRSFVNSSRNTQNSF